MFEGANADHETDGVVGPGVIEGEGVAGVVSPLHELLPFFGGNGPGDKGGRFFCREEVFICGCVGSPGTICVSGRQDVVDLRDGLWVIEANGYVSGYRIVGFTFCCGLVDVGLVCSVVGVEDFEQDDSSFSGLDVAYRDGEGI